jgi:hypothetical protein
VWSAALLCQIVGPIFFETTVNSPVYQDIITQFIALFVDFAFLRCKDLTIIVSAVCLVVCALNQQNIIA